MILMGVVIFQNKIQNWKEERRRAKTLVAFGVLIRKYSHVCKIPISKGDEDYVSCKCFVYIDFFI